MLEARRTPSTPRFLSLLIVVLLTGCQPGQGPDWPAVQEHVLDRAGFGPDAWTDARIAEIGVGAYLLEQLDPDALPDPEMPGLLAAYPSLELGFQELRASYGGDGQPARGTILRELQDAKILRAIASRRQLQEVLVDFWFNHFNVAVDGNRRSYDISPYERMTIRPHVLGRFEDLLLAVARSPAMGDYLDNRRNEVGKLNENFSRELLELHTMGVDGGYTETDVVEVARCLTGWREDYSAPDGFGFRADKHDQDPKTVLGTLEIPANGGEQDGRDLIAFLARHPSTARHVSRKLVTRFVSETPPDALVDAAAQTFLETDGDLRLVMVRILFSGEFMNRPENRHSKVKRPLQFFASAARATGADPALLNLGTIRSRLRDLSEELYRAAPPTGYPDASAFWASPGAVLLRFNLAERVARGRDGWSFEYPPTGASGTELVGALVDELFVHGVSTDTQDNAIAFADALSTSETRRVEQTAAVLLSSPDFLLH